MALLCQMTLIPHKLETIQIQIAAIYGWTCDVKPAFLLFLLFHCVKFGRNPSLPVSVSAGSSLLASAAQSMEHVLYLNNHQIRDRLKKIDPGAYPLW